MDFDSHSEMMSALPGHEDSSMHHGSSGSIHADDPGKLKEHMALLDLLPHSEATHVAVSDGSWFDASTWKDGKIPGTGAKVLIPKGRSVSYDSISDESLKVVRVDGNLSFAHNQNTKLVVDTLFTDASSTLSIGTRANPIQADKTAQIIVDGSTAIDTNWDPIQISRGVVTHGKVEIYGAEKADFLTLAQDAQAGDRTLFLQEAPTGWQVGDQIVLGGTQTNENGSHDDNSKFQDEVLTITEISGNQVKFTNNDVTSGDNTALRFDHTRPDAFKDQLNLYVANTTRNISFETANADEVPTQQRGHVMFMHNPDVVVQNAGFYNLGRSDKSKIVDDIGKNRDGSDGDGTNIRGRYSLHFHRTGADDISSTPSSAKGNAVVGSPGWAIVHHDSHAIIEDNVVFDFYGSGISAEDGNELGTWRNNIAIKGTGFRDNANNSFGANKPRLNIFDMGFGGEGYWVQGAAQIDIEDNIAISTGTGINLFGGGDGGDEARTINDFSTKNLPPELLDIAPGKDTVSVTQVPLKKFSGFEIYNSKDGIIFWARVRDDAGENFHDVRSVAEDFKLWNIQDNGVDVWYSTKIDFVDGLILGDSEGKGRKGITGNSLGQDHLYKDLHIEGFSQGLRVPREGEGGGAASVSSRIEDSTFRNNTVDFSDRNSKFLVNNDSKTAVFPDNFEIVNTTFDSDSDNSAPTASFETEALGGLGFEFDAIASSDSDEPKSSTLSNEGIASYGWDFDNDGNIDNFGRDARHYFDQAGTQQVSLTVWDEHGSTNTTTQTIDVTPVAYQNLLQDGGFDKPDNFKAGSHINDFTADRGWGGLKWIHDPNLGDGGAAVVNSSTGGGLIGQIVLDENIRRGEQTVSLDVKNIEGDSKSNSLRVEVWGIDGERGTGFLDQSGPRSRGVLPFESTKLLDETVGGSTFDWTTFNWNLNFGSGFETIVFRARSSNSLGGNDLIAIDNVSITGDGQNAPAPASGPVPGGNDAPTEDVDTPVLPDTESENNVDSPSQPESLEDSSGNSADRPDSTPIIEPPTQPDPEVGDSTNDFDGSLTPDSEMPTSETPTLEIPSSESDSPTGENNLMKFYLIDTATNQLIRPLTSGESIDPNAIAAKEFSIVAEPDASTFNQVKSVKFFLNGEAVRTENTPPYALFGDKSGDFHGAAFENGTFNLSVEAYSGADGTGDKLVTADLQYEVAELTQDTTVLSSADGAGDSPTPEAPISESDSSSLESSSDNLLKLYLVDADTDQVIEELEPGKLVDVSTVGAKQLSIIAEPNPAMSAANQVESVKFFLNGQEVSIESVPPYAIFGDENGDISGKVLEDGAFIVKAEAYSSANANGDLLSVTELGYELSGSPSGSDGVDQSPAALVAQFDELIFHADGNINDSDDITSMAVLASVANGLGLEDKLTIFHGNNLSEGNNDIQVEALQNAAAFAEKLGVDTVSYQDGVDKATTELVKIFDSGKKVLSMEAGPMEAVYRALEQTSSENRKNVVLLSHSSWNEDRDKGSRPGGGEPRTWRNIGEDFPEVQRIDIKNQNGKDASGQNISDVGFYNDDWNFLDNSNDPVLQEMRVVMKTAIRQINGADKSNDASDFGMFYYALTGDENGEPRNVEALLEVNPPSYLSGDSSSPSEPVIDGSGQPPVEDSTDGTGDSPTPEAPVSEPDGSGSETSSDDLLKLYLVDAGTDQIIEELTPGKLIDADVVGETGFSIIAEAGDSQVESVKFFLDGQQVKIENTPPYALFGDKDGDFHGESLEGGTFAIAAEAYSGQDATGEKLGSVELSYEVSGAAAPTSPDPVIEEPTDSGSTPTSSDGGIDTGSDAGDLGSEPNQPTTNPDALVNQFDHIVSHFDGNNRDTDDIAALPIAAALTNASGLQDKSTFFYGNNIGEPNIDEQVKDMRASAAFAEKLGIKTHDYQSGLNQTTDELVKIFNSGQKVLVLEGGRMEMTYRAFEKTDSDKIKNITLLSHSTNNEDYTRNGSRTWSDLKSDFPDATFIDIQNQNGTSDSNGFNSSKWTWLDSTNDPLLQELRGHMLEAGYKYGEAKFNDPSDAGMHFFAITGDESGGPLDAKAFLEANSPSFTSSQPSTPTPTLEPSPEPTPSPTSTDTSSDSLVFMANNGRVVIEAENTELQGHWTPRTVDGEDTVLWDPAYSKAARGDAGETLSYSFVTDEAGDYNLAMRFGRVKDAMSDIDLLEDGKERTDTGNDAYISLINAETGEVIQDQVKASTYLGSSDEELRWGTTVSVNHQKSPATFELDANTEYRLEVTGRSDGYALDRITLSNDGFLTDANVPQSSTQGSSNDTAVLSSGPLNASPSLSTAEPTAPELSGLSSDSTSNELSQEVLELTNAFRAKKGLSPLSLNQDLTEAAQDHVQDMAQGDFFSHTGLDGSTILARVQEAGYMPQVAGENIAAGQVTPEEVVQAWIESPGHRANLLSDQFTEIGIGHTFLENDTGSVNYNHYWGQAFGQSSEAGDFGVTPQSSGDFVRTMAEAGFQTSMGSMGNTAGNGGLAFDGGYGLANLESTDELHGIELFTVSEGVGNQTETHQDELMPAHLCGIMKAFPVPEADSLAA